MLIRQHDYCTCVPRDGYRLHFIDTDIAYQYRYLSILLSILFSAKKYDENVKLFYNCWTLASVLKFFSLEQWVIFLFVFYFLNIKVMVHPINENVVIIYSLSSCFKPELVYFFCYT